LARFADAEAVLREGVAIDEKYATWKRSQRQQILASTLARQARDDEALEHYRRGLEFARLDMDESDNGITIARYFLADHLVKMQRYEEVLALLPKSLAKDAFAGLIYFQRARSLAGLGRTADARKEATQALAASRSEEQRANLRKQLAGLV